MVRIPYIKIPSVHVGSIDLTTDIGTGGATPAPPTPITYLTQWKIVGNSEVHGNEIWSCGEYNPTDGKYHILVQPLGGSIADIALDEPLRKVNNVTDTIEFPSGTEGKVLVTRPFKQINMSSLEWWQGNTGVSNSHRYLAPIPDAYPYEANRIVLTMNTGGYINTQGNNTWTDIGNNQLIGMYPTIGGYPVPHFAIYDPNYDKEGDLSAFLTYLADKLIIYRLATPTIELVDAPLIEFADSYSCVISQGGKAVSWSEFIYTLNYLLTDSQNNLLVDSENYQLTVQS